MQKRVIFTVSDSSGETTERVVRVVLEQFNGADVSVRRHIDVKDTGTLCTITKDAAAEGAFVMYTLGDEALSREASDQIHAYGLQGFDLLTECVVRVGGWLQRAPHHRVGHRIDDAYYSRIAAIDFAQQHDDGQRMDDLDRADVVILGLSRTSKTPVSHELARRGLRVANVPLALELQLPQAVALVDPRKVFMLCMSIERLHKIRQSRLKSLGDIPKYADPRHITEEIQMVQRLLAAHPTWNAVDVTNRAIEDIASLIRQRLERVMLRQ